VANGCHAVFVRGLFIVLRQHQASTPFIQPEEPRAPRSAGSRVQRRAFRRSLIVFLSLSSVPVGLGVLMTLPPGRLRDQLQTFSDIPARFFSDAGSRFDASSPSDADAKGEPGSRPSLAAHADAAVREGDVLVYGDRLKITFYESLGVTLEDHRDSPVQTITTIFPRMDLSAEYSVDAGGGLSIPRLGEFQAAGKTTSALRAALAASFERAIGRTSDVHIAIVERQPIYILGTVRNAGTFKHTPGMTVLQALAVAGGVDPGIADTSRTIESIRETQRLRQAEAALSRLLINQARLVALRDDADHITVPADIVLRMSDTASRDELGNLIDGARATLAIERAGYQRQVTLGDRQSGIARVELEAQTMRAGQLTVLLTRKSDRLRDLEGIAARGSVSQLKLTDVEADVAEIVSRREDLRVSIAQTERRLIEAEIALAKIQLDHSAGIDKELSATRQEIDDRTREIDAMRAVTRVLRDGVAGASAGPPSLGVTRRTADGATVLPATESTALLPGDVVQVNFVPRFGADDKRPAQNVTISRK
jgi:exopolysaccharide production protein ExoF